MREAVPSPALPPRLLLALLALPALLRTAAAEELFGIHHHHPAPGIAPAGVQAASAPKPTPSAPGAGRSAAEWEHALSRHRFHISAEQARMSVVTHGNWGRMRRAMAKLLTGENMTVAVIGGSISAGQGAGGLTNAYVSRMSDWLRDTFPQRPETVNGAFPGAPSSYMSLCVQEHIPRAAQIVFVEYAVNDDDLASIGPKSAWGTSPPKRAFERLLRQLLDFPSRPAVVLFELFSWLRHEGNFWLTGEDSHGVLAKYYGIPVISSRSAFYHSWRLEEPGFKLNMSQDPEDFYRDVVHPNMHGHAKVADLAINYLRTVARSVLHQPLTIDDIASAEGAIPPPMIPGNHHQDTANKCIQGREQLPKYVVDARGFELVNESREPWRFSKWGYVATEPGATLVLTVDTTSAAASGNVDLYLAHLRSYEGMGKFEVSCISGCECQPAVMNGHHQSRASQRFLTAVVVTQHPECHVQVEALAETDSGGHKVRIDGMVVSTEASVRGLHIAGVFPGAFREPGLG
eukprot:jgi/Tetstr1/430684/TSEL_020477.t1